MIKLLALDMDGTLLDDQNKIPESTVAAIKQSAEAGIKVILASARPVCAMMPYYKQLCLDPTPIIALCGAYILDVKNTKELFECSLSDEICQKIYELFEGRYIKIYGKSTLYVNEIKAETLRYAENFQVDYHKIEINRNTKIPEKIYRIFIPGLSNSETEESLKLINAGADQVASKLEHGIEILPPHINKGMAVEFLCKQYGIAREHVMAIGNEGSDISMVEFAQIGVAVANAHTDLKNVANEITAANTQLGVELMIKKYCL